MSGDKVNPILSSEQIKNLKKNSNFGKVNWGKIITLERSISLRKAKDKSHVRTSQKMVKVILIPRIKLATGKTRTSRMVFNPISGA